MSKRETLRLEERRRYLAFAFCWADLLFELRGGRIAYVAGATESLLGRSSQDLLSQRFASVIHPDDLPLVERLLRLVGLCGRVDEASCRLQAENGEWRRVSLAGHSLGAEEAEGESSLFLAVKLRFGDEDGEQSDKLLSPEHFAELTAKRLSLGDAAPDSRLILLNIEGEAGAGDAEGPPVLQSDVERRLNWNAALAACIRAHAIDGRLAARIDDKHYGLLCTASADAESLKTELQDLSRAVSGGGEGLAVRTATLDSGDLKEVSENDLARGLLYTLRSFEKQREQDLTLKSLAGSLDNLVSQAAGKITAFKQMIAGRQFRFVLQPIIDLSSGEIAHFEALCRFEEGAVGRSPAALIAFAEETGLIQDFDLAMIEQVLAWIKARPINAERLRIAVNVSGASVLHSRFGRSLLGMLAKYPEAVGVLSFEVTETAQIEDLPRANALLRSLRRRGFQVCLDDFGAGAASFRYLNALDVDAVKLDGAAIRRARKSLKGQAFLSALTQLCRQMGVKTVAEMVEDQEGLDFVRSCGCDYVQGYLFGKPSADPRRFMPYPNRVLLQSHTLLRQ